MSGRRAGILRADRYSDALVLRDGRIVGRTGFYWDGGTLD